MYYHDVLVAVLGGPAPDRARLVFVQHQRAEKVLLHRGVPIGGSAIRVDQRHLGIREQIFKGRSRLGGTERDRYRQHVVARNQLAGGGHRALRVHGVILHNQRKFASFDAAPVVHHVQVSLDADTMRHAVGRNRPGQGHPASQLDLFVGHAGSLLGQSVADAQSQKAAGGNTAFEHGTSCFLSLIHGAVLSCG